MKNISFCDNRRIAKICGKDALHQGIAVVAEKLTQPDLKEVLHVTRKRSLVIILDNITDPFNVGNIIRSSKAFGVDFLIMRERHSPDETSIIAKAASGAFESIPICSVSNLGNAIKTLQDSGYFCYALDGDTQSKITNEVLPDKTVFILGSEGKGVSPILKSRCDQVLAIPMHACESFDSINVSSAAAIAMFKFYTQS